LCHRLLHHRMEQQEPGPVSLEIDKVGRIMTCNLLLPQY
jgi:hypothetical protein